MKLEPETLFIGIIDLFSIVLPGAIAASFLTRRVAPVLFKDLFPAYTSEGAKLAVFLFSSYLLGHFIFLVGSFLDEFVYDKLRSRIKDEEAALLNAIKKQLDSVTKNGKVWLLNEISTQVQAAADAPKEEQLQMIEKIRKAIEVANKQLKANPQSDQLAVLQSIDKEMRKYSDRQNSWFSRSFKWVLTLAFAKTPDVAVNRVLEIKRKYVPDVKGKAVVNAFQWAKALLAIKSPNALVEVQRLEANSKFFRSLFVILLLLTAWLAWKTFRGDSNWPVLAACLFFSGLSFFRYVEQRFKSTQQAYWYVITMEGIPLPVTETT